MITFDDVSFSFLDEQQPEERNPVIAHADFVIPEGDLVLVTGTTGSGKSTLLKLLNGLVPQFSGGEFSGTITVAGRNPTLLRGRKMADVVGYVGQSPQAGFVTDTVEEELAYSMEQLGISPSVMRKRVEETLDVLGIAELRDRALADLSGGQQQRVAIASVLTTHPQVLVLDEPTSALDPTAAHEVLAILQDLVLDSALTVVLAEHRLERVMQAADSLLDLPGDGTVHFGPAAQILASSAIKPPLVELAHQLNWTELPLSVRDARRRVHREQIRIKTPTAPSYVAHDQPSIQLQQLSYCYGPITALKAISTEFYPGMITTVIGRNGSGKSTLMWAIQGSLAHRKSVLINGQDMSQFKPRQARKICALVPQNAADLLYLPTVAAECQQSDREAGVRAGTTAALLATFGSEFDHDKNPRDLSQGQQLALVLAIQLAAAPDVILLDEPTRGLDYEMKAALKRHVQALADQGCTVVISTHDIEFVAACSQRTIMLAQGEIVADGSTRSICTSSPALAPQCAKVFAPIPVLTPQEVITR